jgi:ribonuclease P protein component
LAYKTKLPRHFYSSENLRLFYLKEASSPLQISTPKKLFKTAVSRNRIKRIIKEVFRTGGLEPVSGGFLVLVYESFSGLSFKEASFEIVKAVKSHQNKIIFNHE